MREGAMNCPSCGAPMRLAQGNASLRCDYCKNVVVAPADDAGVRYLDEAEKMACPVCAVPLFNATLAGIEIQSCKRCHGMLVAMARFEPLIEQVSENGGGSESSSTADKSELGRKINCPGCRRTMDAHFYYGGGHAVIEGCENCSLNWLDGGVLMQIVRARHLSDAEA
jgi:LSD1 subclass zinc finger protein